MRLKIGSAVGESFLRRRALCDANLKPRDIGTLPDPGTLGTYSEDIFSSHGRDLRFKYHTTLRSSQLESRGF